MDWPWVNQESTRQERYKRTTRKRGWWGRTRKVKQHEVLEVLEAKAKTRPARGRSYRGGSGKSTVRVSEGVSVQCGNRGQ
jgi:hypothetical protein